MLYQSDRSLDHTISLPNQYRPPDFLVRTQIWFLDQKPSFSLHSHNYDREYPEPINNPYPGSPSKIERKIPTRIDITISKFYARIWIKSLCEQNNIRTSYVFNFIDYYQINFLSIHPHFDFINLFTFALIPIWITTSILISVGYLINNSLNSDQFVFRKQLENFKNR